MNENKSLEMQPANKTPLPDTRLSETTELSVFGSISHFEQAQRMAKALSTSTIVPDTYRGDANMGNCLIALEIANRIGAGVLAVMQNLYIVYGRPAWSSQFLISCVNASRKFTPLRYKMTGEKNTDTWGCIAWAQDQTGERLESPEITISTAKAEGWYQKNGSKWKTMPELMLRYRTATLFCRLYAPELVLGIKTDDEVIDIETVDVAPVVTEPKRPNFGDAPRLSPPAPQTQRAPEVAPPNPASQLAPEPPKPRKPAKPAPAVLPATGPDAEEDPFASPQAPPVAPVAQPIIEVPPAVELAPAAQARPQITALRLVMAKLGLSDDDMLQVCLTKGVRQVKKATADGVINMILDEIDEPTCGQLARLIVTDSVWMEVVRGQLDGKK